MPRSPEPQPSQFSIAVTSSIRRLKADRRISNAEIAEATGLSANYIAERLRDEKSFTLTDMEALGEFFGFDAAEFLVEASRTTGNVTPIRPNVGARSEAVREDTGRAASKTAKKSTPKPTLEDNTP